MKRYMPILAVLLVSGALFGAVAAMNRGFSVSVGRCMIEDHGSCLLILDDCPVVRSRKGAGKNPWMKLETGDQLLVVHDGIEEFYSGNQGLFSGI